MGRLTFDFDHPVTITPNESACLLMGKGTLKWSIQFHISLIKDFISFTSIFTQILDMPVYVNIMAGPTSNMQMSWQVQYFTNFSKCIRDHLRSLIKSMANHKTVNVILM